MMVQLAETVDELETLVVGSKSTTPNSSLLDKDNVESDIFAVVVTGSDSTFCSGVDLSVDSFLSQEAGACFSSLMQNTLMRLAKLPLISVAAVEGFAIGGGAEMAVSCDHIVMSDEAAIRFSQAQMGVVPGWGGGFRLTQRVGPKHSLDILCSAKRFSANDALKIGLIDSISKKGESEAFAFDLLSNRYFSTAQSSEVLRGMKNVVLNSSTQNWDDIIAREGNEFKKLW
ncbi:enoyl CoA hydratase domain-containing protein 1, partial [Nowakowskiella sp. JEL0078]